VDVLLPAVVLYPGGQLEGSSWNKSAAVPRQNCSYYTVPSIAWCQRICVHRTRSFIKPRRKQDPNSKGEKGTAYEADDLFDENRTCKLAARTNSRSETMQWWPIFHSPEQKNLLN
jgi:hypothetical protein